jgi:chromate transporter
VCLLFLKLGAIGFGGPAVTIAMMEDEVVTRRQWLSRDYFMDLIGTTNLIPGPNATEIAIHVGYLRAGWPGLVLSGACFVIPAALITGAFAWAYVRFGSLPRITPFLQGIKPAVLAVIVAALWRLGKTAVKGWRLGLMGLAVMVASLLGVSEILALFAGGILGMAWLQADRVRRLFGGRDVGALGLLAPGLGWGLAAVTDITWWSLGLFFLKIGSVMYGSGYVLVAFLQGGLVDDLGWLTQQQLLDAIAAGQLTPGPLLSTATFIGYLLLGIPGVMVATVGVFLPSFLFVAALSPIVPRFRRSPWVASFLDSVNVCSLGLMAAVTVELGAATLRGWPSVLIALAAAAAALRWKLKSAWLVLGGAVVGWVVSALI